MINSRCIKGVLSESDYNQTWIVHNAMSEALERLLLTHFLTEVSGVNMFTASNRTSGHISTMIKGVEYHISQSKVKVQHRAIGNENSCVGKFNTKAMKKMNGIYSSSEIHKPLRPSQILMSEKLVAEVIRAFIV